MAGKVASHLHIRESRLDTAGVRQPLSSYVKTHLDNYFDDLEGYQPANLYHMVMDEVEKPLLETIMQKTGGNQTRAAAILGINRSTLRKKLALHGLD